MFEPSRLVNSLESICQSLDIDIEKVRGFSRRVTREQVKKLEFLERAGGRDARALLAVFQGTVEISNDEEDEDDGGF